MYPTRSLHGVPRGRPPAPWRGAGPLPRFERTLYMDNGGAVAKRSVKAKRVGFPLFPPLFVFFLAVFLNEMARCQSGLHSTGSGGRHVKLSQARDPAAPS